MMKMEHKECKFISRTFTQEFLSSFKDSVTWIFIYIVKSHYWSKLLNTHETRMLSMPESFRTSIPTVGGLFLPFQGSFELFWLNCLRTKHFQVSLVKVSEYACRVSKSQSTHLFQTYLLSTCLCQDFNFYVIKTFTLPKPNLHRNVKIIVICFKNTKY